MPCLALTQTEALTKTQLDRETPTGSASYYNYYLMDKVDENKYKLIVNDNDYYAQTNTYTISLKTLIKLRENVDELDTLIFYSESIKQQKMDVSYISYNKLKKRINDIETITKEEFPTPKDKTFDRKMGKIIDELKNRESEVRNKILKNRIENRALISNLDNGKRAITFQQQTICNIGTKETVTLRINEQNVRFHRVCNMVDGGSSDTYYNIFAVSEAGENYVISQFKLKSWVNIKFLNENYEFKFWANGFTAAWNDFGDAL